MGKKRNRSSKSESGLTPPSKTVNKTVNMASNPEIKSPEQQQPFSHVLGQAYESYISPHSNLPFNGSPNQLQSTFTVNPMNVNNQAMNIPQIQTQIPPQFQQPIVMLPNQLPIGQSTPVPAPNRSGNFHLPATVSKPNTTVLQMLFTNMEIINKKLSKLDGIDKLNDKFDKLELDLVNMRKEIDEIKEIQKTHANILDHEEHHHHEIADRMTNLENINYDLEQENRELREDLLKLQTHSMKYNLIFSGIKQDDGENENTEAALRHFLVTELEMSNVSEIEFQNVHRLKPRSDGKPGILFRNLQTIKIMKE